MKNLLHNYLDDVEDIHELRKKPFPSLDALQDAEMHLMQRNSVRDSWKRTITGSGPYAVLWTLSFCRAYDDATALDALDAAAKFVSRKMGGPRWQKHHRGIDALVVAEAHVVSRGLRGRLHFHVLVKQQDHIADPSELADELESCCLRLTDETGRRMTTKERVHATEVWDLPGLADYLSKAMTSSRWGGVGGNIFFLRNASVEGVVMPLKAERELARLH